MDRIYPPKCQVENGSENAVFKCTFGKWRPVVLG